MENVSILDQIINNQKAEEVARLDAVEIINNLFGELSERERDVVVRRYGLHGQGKETLESIGGAHKLTRERIRQIETTSIRKLQQLKNLDKYINTLKKVIFELLEEHGGLMEREYLLETLVGFSVSGFKVEDDKRLIHKNYLNFLITKLLHDEFEEGASSKYFKESYKLKYRQIEHLEEIVEQVLEHIKENKKTFRTHELVEIVRGFDAYKKHEEKFNADSSLDISWALCNEFFEENTDVINKNKIVYSILRAAKKIEQNKFGNWGIHNWREIKPKTINDKIHLIFRQHKQPLHFVEIAEKINQIGFDSKKANPATVHNELILDDKYVLVGRGLYGLKEWGYKNGTVAEVIEEIFNEGSDQLLSRDAIIDKVLEKRVVKRATIILSLMNKDKFERVNGKYRMIVK